MLHLLSRVVAALGVLLLLICLAAFALAGAASAPGGATPAGCSDGGARELLERVEGDGQQARDMGLR